MSRHKTFARLPGFRDFDPEALAFRQHIFEAWRRVSRRYGFAEYDGPPLEPLDLYTEKSGAEIVGQLYHFVDKGDRPVTLRPEMTPSLARILAERSRGMAKPIRWFAIPQLFRYERQQRGRLREHFQWNVDVVGEAGVAADVEVVAVAIDGLRELGLTADDYRARVSDRRILGGLLEALGVGEEQAPGVFAVIDRMEREGFDRSADRLRDEVGLEHASVEEILRLFREPGLERLADRFGDRPQLEGPLAAMKGYLGDLEALGLGDFVEFDLKIVRGLAYYTGIVFELFDRQGELRAICGGGRYDRLLELVGGEPLPAAGFGMGDVVLGELLKDRGLGPGYRAAVDYYIVTVAPELRSLALEIARAQRAKGLSVVYPLRARPVRKQFASAAREGARHTIVLGPDEVQKGMATVRDMETGEQRQIALRELTE